MRIHKRVESRPVRVDEPVLRDEVLVARVPINQYVSGPVPVRYEGDTMILPVLEEVVVTEKRLVLREEVHVTRRQVEGRNPQDVVLRREAVEVERVDEDAALRERPRYSGRDWNVIENDARRDGEARNPGGAWEDAKLAIRHGWDKVRGRA